ncbi:hypothetical protein ACFLT0_01330 [Chloroflexota bacterium]
MVTNNQDVLARAYATLSALRKNTGEITDRNGIKETYVRKFHSVLDRLESIGLDVSEFRIPDSEVKRQITSKHMGGGRSYTDEKYVEQSFLLTKLDAILGYFEIITPEKPKRIGFSTPENR